MTINEKVKLLQNQHNNALYLNLYTEIYNKFYNIYKQTYNEDVIKSVLIKFLANGTFKRAIETYKEDLSQFITYTGNILKFRLQDCKKQLDQSQIPVAKNGTSMGLIGEVCESSYINPEFNYLLNENIKLFMDRLSNITNMKRITAVLLRIIIPDFITLERIAKTLNISKTTFGTRLRRARIQNFREEISYLKSFRYVDFHFLFNDLSTKDKQLMSDIYSSRKEFMNLTEKELKRFKKLIFIIAHQLKEEEL